MYLLQWLHYGNFDLRSPSHFLSYTLSLLSPCNRQKQIVVYIIRKFYSSTQGLRLSFFSIFLFFPYNFFSCFRPPVEAKAQLIDTALLRLYSNLENILWKLTKLWHFKWYLYELLFILHDPVQSPMINFRYSATWKLPQNALAEMLIFQKFCVGNGFRLVQDYVG